MYWFSNKISNTRNYLFVNYGITRCKEIGAAGLAYNLSAWEVKRNIRNSRSFSLLSEFEVSLGYMLEILSQTKRREV